jgi:hypothetical protein
MNPSEALRGKLADLRFADGRRTIAADADGWTVAVAADCVDRLGCQVWELTLTRTGAAAAANLKARGEALAARCTGLLEPLALVEVDAEAKAALLRSAPPSRREDGLFYYEVLLQPDAAAFRRFQAPQAGGKRSQIAFTLTHDALAKLVDDLTAA